MNLIKSFLGLLGRTLLLWLTLDFFAGNYILTVSGLAENAGGGIKHDVYHHDLASNYSGFAGWGDFEYPICTNDFGFRDTCSKNKQLNSKTIDVAFIGDSFTKAVGVDWDDSYVGLVKNKFSSLNIANLGVSSYAPSIYYSKLKYLLEKGFEIKKLVVAIDISDIQDEIKSYRLLEDGRVVDRKEKTTLQKIKSFNRWAFPLTVRLRRIQLDSEKQSRHEVKSIGEIHPFEKPQYAWTYKNIPAEDFGEMSSDDALRVASKNMMKLATLAADHKIDLHVMVYPWPGQLLYDKASSLQVSHWEEFCVNNCVAFINTFPDFFDASESVGADSFIEKMYIPGDVHFSADGNKFLFESFLKNQKVFE